MFRRQPQPIEGLILKHLRANGLETPLLQRRLVAAWPQVAGQVLARYTRDVHIESQTLWVSLSVPAARAELMMRRQLLVRALNAAVGANIITEIRIR